jgi:uncharacterized protein (TIGR02596 family)
MASQYLSRTTKKAGFSLIELIAVLAITTAVATLAIPAFSSVLRSSQLSEGAQIMVDQLNYARQAALSKNRAVEVRLLQYAEMQMPGEKVGDPQTGKFRALQLFEISELGTARALGKVWRLPESIIIDSGGTLSSLIASALPLPNVPTLTTTPVPSAEKQGPYRVTSFRFLPDGSTNLSPAATRWFLTLHDIRDGDGPPVTPKNFFTIQIDANNGHIRTIRP